MTSRDEARRLVQGFREYQVIVAACKLKIPDLLAAGPATADELAAATQTREPSMRRFLRGLVAIGAVAEQSGDRFAATEVLDFFRSDKPGLRNMALMLSEEAYRTWGHLTYSLRTGTPAFEHVFGKPRWEALAGDPEAAATFNAAMIEMTSRIAVDFVAAYDFTGVRTVADIGGGNGALITAVLEAHPEMRGVLFDLSQGLAGARDLIDARGVGDRIELVEGSFFESVPRGADLYLLKSIIHDWDDERAEEILRTSRGGMTAASRIVVIERLLPARNEASVAALEAVMSDLNMMVVLGGRERTPDEYGALFAKTGLQMTRWLPAGASGWGIFEARPAADVRAEAPTSD